MHVFMIMRGSQVCPAERRGQTRQISAANNNKQSTNKQNTPSTTNTQSTERQTTKQTRTSSTSLTSENCGFSSIGKFLHGSNRFCKETRQQPTSTHQHISIEHQHNNKMQTFSPSASTCSQLMPAKNGCTCTSSGSAASK